MPELIYSSETFGCGATIKLDNGDVCIISVARSSIIVRSYRHGSLFGSFFGPILYKEKSVSKALNMAMNLAGQYPKRTVLPPFRNMLLDAFAHTIWHCSSAPAVRATLNEAAVNEAAVNAQVEDICKAAGMGAASEAAENRKAEMRVPLTRQVIYSDGQTSEVSLMPWEIDRWAVGSNELFERESRPYRIVRIIDSDDAIVWPS